MSSLIFRRASEHWREMKTEFDDHVRVQYVTADQHCHGYLLNKRGKAEHIDPESLFTGPEARAYLYASDELVEFWGKYGRTTLPQFERGWVDGNGLN